MSEDTDFAIVGRPIPAASMRGMKGDLSPIDNGVLVEMLDFSMRDQTSVEGQKFEGTLSCDDIQSPPFAGAWKGTRWTIDYPAEFIEPLGEPQTRPEVPGSMYWIDAEDSEEVDEGDPQAAFRVYRPRLDIIIVEPWKVSFSEWEATTSWSLKWREV